VTLPSTGTDQGGTPSQTEAPPTRTRAVVYLDQLHWISLARASTRHPLGAPYIGVLAYLRQAVLDRRAVFPLSSTHHAELHGNVNYRQRTDVAAVMSLLSGHQTISGVGPIRRAELERALHDRFGSPAEPAVVKPLGWGVHFALGQPAKRLRLVGTAEARAAFAQRFGGEEALKRWEWEMAFLAEDEILRGPADGEIEILRRDYGYKPEAFDEVVKARARREQDLADRMKADPGLKKRIDDLVGARTFYWEVSYLLPEVLPPNGITFDEFFAGAKDWLVALCEQMPTVAVIEALAKANHTAAADRPWRPNDIHDIDALSVAIPYCDIVVTERHFCTQVSKTSLAARFNTVILPRLEELPDAIESWHTDDPRRGSAESR
jgi:hypothetical protein